MRSVIACLRARFPSAEMANARGRLSVLEWQVAQLKDELAATDSGLSALERRLAQAENGMSPTEVVVALRHEVTHLRNLVASPSAERSA